MERTITFTPAKATWGTKAAQAPHAPTMAESVAQKWILRGSNGCGFDGSIGHEAARSPAVPPNSNISH